MEGKKAELQQWNYIQRIVQSRSLARVEWKSNYFQHYCPSVQYSNSRERIADQPSLPPQSLQKSKQNS